MDTESFRCIECHKEFTTKSNLRRHMENPNIHNKPYERTRDQKRWKDHERKNPSRQELSERMRKWRAENAEKNKDNDTRCRVYRLAKVKFGPDSTPEKQKWIQEEINKRISRRKQREKQYQTYGKLQEDQAYCTTPAPSPSLERSLDLALTPLPTKLTQNPASTVRLPAISELLLPTFQPSKPPPIAPTSKSSNVFPSYVSNPQSDTLISVCRDLNEREYAHGHAWRQKLELLQTSADPSHSRTKHTLDQFCLDVLEYAKLPV
ncbi:hypothetical protein K493DRAFT_376415 [Basidiobolus meristosporus CBS 931.73]|uniref:C2H2-type domain-containing protein n=1 Tax=Basidiobolus meristosporus CBS 931.73 TaxID=1314790 RepID=A0A1Y1Y415_9FUNG|nr:hypothetical protein K493DRAFT_376415 [Basidiobolus meristosporus CBS 931.73]|eukprot:ORX92723.1 hypothetical protein K493DRAFT_376415 [Basidiobolus meristosporus CBS 931.73]